MRFIQITQRVVNVDEESLLLSLLLGRVGWRRQDHPGDVTPLFMRFFVRFLQVFEAPRAEKVEGGGVSSENGARARRQVWPATHRPRGLPMRLRRFPSSTLPPFPRSRPLRAPDRTLAPRARASSSPFPAYGSGGGPRCNLCSPLIGWNRHPSSRPWGF